MAIPAGWRHNLGLKLLSAGLALLLYFHVHGTKIVEREIALPLRVENLPDSLLLLDDPPQTARVLVSGPAQDLFFLRFVPGAGLRVDLAQARPPAVSIGLAAADVNLGDDDRLVVQRIEPRTLDLGIDRRAERSVPVQVAYTGHPAAGHAVVGTFVEPREVVCTGPATRLADLRQVSTQPLDVTGRTGRFTVHLDVLPEGDRVTCEPRTVTVEAVVERERQRALLERPVTLVDPPGDGLTVDIRPSQVSITISGPEDAVEALDPDEIQIVLDGGPLRSGDRRRLPLEPRLPGWARLDGLVPDSVDVVVRRRPGRR